jgi:hypothetical protein
MSHITGTATDYMDLVDTLNTFLTAQGHAWGKVYTGTGDGDLVDYIGTASSVAETFTLEATGATTFTVVGTVTGALANATVGTPYTSAVIEFLIEAGSTAFIAGDTFLISTSPPYELIRRGGAADATRRSTDFTSGENLFTGTGTATRSATSGFFEFDMRLPVPVRTLRIQIGTTATLSPRDFALQYRDDPGDAWTTAESWTAITWSASEAKEFAIASTPGTRRYWRVDITASNGASITLAALSLRESPTSTGASWGIRYAITWRAPGLDGTKDIYLHAISWGRSDTDVFNLGFSSSRVYDASLTNTTQPNSSALRYASLANAPISYWITANGQRVMIMLKLSSLYQCVYLGFGSPYEPPSRHAFPCIVAASHNVVDRRFSDTNQAYRIPTDPGFGVQAFYPDAQWRAHQNRTTTTSSTVDGASAASGGKVWPAELNFTNGTALDFIALNVDDTAPLLPCILTRNATPEHAFGEYDGLYWTTGLAAFPEQIITEGGFDHIVFTNVFRTAENHFAAMRLD